jgi:uncharacterized protein (TIGR03000 family)
MSRKVFFVAALTVAAFALTAADASAQFRNRGGRGGTGSPILDYGSQYLGNSLYGNGITVPGTNFTIPGTGSNYNNNNYGNYPGNYNNTYGNYYGNNYGTPYQSGYSPLYQNGYRSGQYYNTSPNYYTVPQTYGSTQVVPSAYSSSDTSQIAMLNVQLPMANAEVWLNDTLTTPQGMDRQFQSPPLDSSKNYTYTVKARWMEGDRMVEKTKDVKVEPGKTSTVSFR